MLYRPYQRAEHAKASQYCDINKEQATKALKPLRKPLQKSKCEKMDMFPTASRFTDAYWDHSFGGGWFGKMWEGSVIQYLLFLALLGYFSHQKHLRHSKTRHYCLIPKAMYICWGWSLSSCRETSTGVSRVPSRSPLSLSNPSGPARVSGLTNSSQTWGTGGQRVWVPAHLVQHTPRQKPKSRKIQIKTETTTNLQSSSV